MAEFALEVMENTTREILRYEGPFYIERKANDTAKQLSREYHSPTVIVIVTATPQKRGYPKLYRMGRLHRQ